MPLLPFHFRALRLAAGPQGPFRPNASGVLGWIAIGLGALTLLVAWVPYLGMLSIPIAGIGIVVAFAGLIVGRVAGQRRLPVPFVGVLVCGLSIGVSLLSTHQWQNRPGAPGRSPPAGPTPPAVDMRGRTGPFVPPPVTQPTFVVPRIPQSPPDVERGEPR